MGQVLGEAPDGEEVSGKEHNWVPQTGTTGSRQQSEGLEAKEEGLLGEGDHQLNQRPQTGPRERVLGAHTLTWILECGSASWSSRVGFLVSVLVRVREEGGGEE